MYVTGPFVETSIGVAPVIDQLVVKFQEQVFIVLTHAGRRVTFCVDVVKSRPECLAHSQWRYAFRGDEDDVT